MNNIEIVIIKNCPPNPNIFLVKEKRMLWIEGAISLYFLVQKRTTDSDISKKQGIPEKTKAKATRLPIVVLVRI